MCLAPPPRSKQHHLAVDGEGRASEGPRKKPAVSDTCCGPFGMNGAAKQGAPMQGQPYDQLRLQSNATHPLCTVLNRSHTHKPAWSLTKTVKGTVIEAATERVEPKLVQRLRAQPRGSSQPVAGVS